MVGDWGGRRFGEVGNFPVAIHSDAIGLGGPQLPPSSKQSAASAVIRRSAHLDTVFADDAEGRQEIGSPKKLPNLFAKIEQF